MSLGKSLRSPTQILLSAICGFVSIKWRGWHQPLVRHLSSGANVNSCHELSVTRLTALISRPPILSFRWLPETMWYHGHVFYMRRYSFKMGVTIIEKYRQLSQSRNAIKVHAEIQLQWRHNGRDSVSNHQSHHCLLNGLFRRRSKKTSKLRVTGLCAGNSPVTGEFPAQMASNAENVSIWWRHHAVLYANELVFASVHLAALNSLS